MSDAFLQQLTLQWAVFSPQQVAVAFSGGLDSSVLLHALAALAPRCGYTLRALHVNHQLHAESTRWSEHCQRVAQQLGVEIKTIAVHVHRDAGLGLEAAARQARYEAFKAELTEDEYLCLAHHRDDQAETVLLKLLRGAGPDGLGAMHERRRFAQAWLWRPWLDVPRASILHYAKQQALTWVEDPSNRDVRLQRNRLRHDLMPQLRNDWPHLDETLAQTSRWMRDINAFMEAKAHEALIQCKDETTKTLHWRAWLALPKALQDPVLRRWLRELCLPQPTHVQVQEWTRQLQQSRSDSQPCLRWCGARLQRYRHALYAMLDEELPDANWSAVWDGRRLTLPTNLGCLELLPVTQSMHHAFIFHVRFRRGGERLRLPGSSHHRELRDLFQEAAIPPWERARMPLVFNDQGILFAVGDRWLSAEAHDVWSQTQHRLLWHKKNTTNAH